MTPEQKSQLIAALVAHGYNLTDATNIANGDPTIAYQRWWEYCGNDNAKVQAFFATWNGQYTKWNPLPEYQRQCVDLMHQYLLDVLGLDPRVLGAHPSARAYYLAFNDTQDFTKIGNTIFNSPRLGDIVFFNIGDFGHVSICNSATWLKLQTFDENWPIGHACQFVSHNYFTQGVMGWLRPKSLKIA